MPSIIQDAWINDQATSYPLSDIEDTAIAVDATYYIQHIILNGSNPSEPLYPALGGMASFEKLLEEDLDKWEAHRVTPLFVFDGQVVAGQDEISMAVGLGAVEQTNMAWKLYSSGLASEAVTAFGQTIGRLRSDSLYPLLQTILRKRQLHFLVAPYNAAAQIAYLDMINSDQCSGIMGSHELFLYPINDCVFTSIDWENENGVTAISKKYLKQFHKLSEQFFVDALLTTGASSFLPPFPGLLDPTVITSQPPNIVDAVNVLRASDKSVSSACSVFREVVKQHDPNWRDKYFKARMVVDHFVYISEAGEVKVHDFEHLTKDNHEYMGLQAPAELFHYLNTGLIGPRLLNWITHRQAVIPPTLDGFLSPEYKTLVQTQTTEIKALALAVLLPGLHRGLQHQAVILKVWYDRDFTYDLNSRNVPREAAVRRITGWTVKEAAIKEILPDFSAGSIASELLALKEPRFVKSTITKAKAKGIDSADSIISLTLWRFLHQRDYINDSHTLTAWGNALATAMLALQPVMEMHSEVPNLNLYEPLVVAFELVRFDILNAKNKHEDLKGLPSSGTEEDQASLLLISRCASLLKLRHQAIGYTGPLFKGLLHFRSLASEVRSADRDLVEAIVASNFMHAQSKRERDDLFEIGHRLPFLEHPDVALGIGVKTYFDEVSLDLSKEDREVKLQEFPQHYLPYAIDFPGDLRIACAFFDAIYAGLKTLDAQHLPLTERTAWDNAAKYLEARR